MGIGQEIPQKASAELQYTEKERVVYLSPPATQLIRQFSFMHFVEFMWVTDHVPHERGDEPL